MSHFPSQESKVRSSLLSSVLLGLFAPFSSLIYARKTGFALSFMAFTILSFVLLVVTPASYFATTTLSILAFVVFLYGLAFFVGFWSVYKNRSLAKQETDQGPMECFYLFFIFTLALLIYNIPIKKFMTKSSLETIAKHDVVAIEIRPQSEHLKMNDYILFYDKDFELQLGKIIALSGDILRKSHHGSFINDEKSPLPLPLDYDSTWHVPEATILLVSAEKNEQIQKDKKTFDASSESKQSSPVKLKKLSESTKLTNFTLIETKQVQSKILYTLLSLDIKNIGKSF